MPVALILHSIPHDNLEMDHITGEALHRLFYTILASGDRQFTEELHTANGIKPFTIALLSKRRKTIRKGEDLLIRFTFLDEVLYAKFTEGALKLSYGFNIKGIELTPSIVNISSSPNSWMGQSSWDGLYKAASDSYIITLQFATPTVFKQGDIDLPLPVPRLIFGAYLEKWNRFSPTKLSEDLPEIFTRNIALTNCAIKSVPFYTVRTVISGFIGSCTFRIRGSLSEELRKQINLLADFAFYAGTGRKTTHGMGMTRRICEQQNSLLTQKLRRREFPVKN